MAIVNIEKAAIVSFNRLEDYLQPLDILETLPYYKTIVMQKDSEFTELFNRQILKMQVRSEVNLHRIQYRGMHFMVRSGFREYEVKKLRSTDCSRQENAIFLLIFTEPRAQHKVHPCNMRQEVGH